MIFNFHNFSDELGEDKYCLSPNKLETFIETLLLSKLTIVGLKQYLSLKDCRLVSFTFDDGWVSHYNLVLPILNRYKLKASFFIVTKLVGNEGYLSWEQIEEIKARGHEVGSHGVNHRSMRNISQTEMDQELLQSKKVIESKLGEEINYFAFPFGKVTRTELRDVYSVYLSTQIEKNFLMDNYILGRTNVKNSDSVKYLVRLAKMKFPEFHVVSCMSKFKNKVS